MGVSWYLARPKSPRQREVEAHLGGMDAGEYVAECRAQGMAWAAVARLLAEDTGVGIDPKQCSALLWQWQRRWEARSGPCPRPGT